MRKLQRVEASLRAVVTDRDLQTRCYVDTGPIVERVYAKYAGVGWIGKNTCILNQKLGSWLFLGVILTNLALTPDLPATDRCGSCTRCLDACPTHAFIGPHEMDATRCIAYLTIEKRGDITEELRPEMGRQVFGCDICQDVCPWNRFSVITSEPTFKPHDDLLKMKSADWQDITEDVFQKVFKNSAVKRTKFSGLKRNIEFLRKVD